MVFVIAASQITAVQMLKSAQKGVNAPFFIMYIKTAMMSICLPLARMIAPTGCSVAPTFFQVAPFLVLWAAANYCYVCALKLASAGVVQTVFGTSPAWVSVLSRIMLKEQFTLARALAVTLAIAGSVAVSISSQQAHAGAGDKDVEGVSQVLMGGAMASAAASAAALYKVGFKFILGDPGVSAVLGFVGTLGVVATFIYLPVSVALSFAGIEDHWWSDAHMNWSALLGGGLISVIFNFSIAYGISIASPVFIALGTILSIPGAIIVDIVVHGEEFGLAKATGAALVSMAFLLLLLAKRPPPPPPPSPQIHLL